MSVIFFFLFEKSISNFVALKFVQQFYGPGGEDPESFYRAFSTEILEAALNVNFSNTN